METLELTNRDAERRGATITAAAARKESQRAQRTRITDRDDAKLAQAQPRVFRGNQCTLSYRGVPT